MGSRTSLDTAEEKISSPAGNPAHSLSLEWLGCSSWGMSSLWPRLHNIHKEYYETLWEQHEICLKNLLTSLRIDETWTRCDWRQPWTKNSTWSSLCSPSTKSLPTENWPQQGLIVILGSSDTAPSRCKYPKIGHVN
jgi:hypothetical protein